MDTPRSLSLREKTQPVNSCYGSLIASTSTGIQRSSNDIPPEDEEFVQAPAFFYDMDFDLRALKASLKSASLLADSGYRSTVVTSSTGTSVINDPSSQPPPRFGTGWMVAEALSDDGDTDSADDSWDGQMNVGTHRVKIKDMSDILASRYAFISGARSNEGLTVVTFPDSRTNLILDDYQLLITYLIQVPSLEESHSGFILIVDRRNDKWSSVRSVLLQIAAYFPGSIRVAFVLKPEGVLQRALEVGYRTIAEQCRFKVILCESSLELRRYLRPEQLSMDVGGLIKYNHLEWVQHRMDIERMKSSAAVIAQSLSDFGRTLRETELPNDAETTARILDAQTAERDAIKEDFRISVRKGLSLLRSVRQLDKKPRADQLSPTRLHNVTAIERMLVQLEETERSFDAFWERHERRLMHCLQLRQFEDAFRKLQAAFARHMMYLEEHREVGDGPERAEILAKQHDEYSLTAQDDVTIARSLRQTGEDLVASHDAEGAGSLLPKCEELERMAEALTSALERRRAVLELSKRMHSQISQANAWCKKGVEVLSTVPFEVTPSSVSNHIDRMDALLQEASTLQLDSLSQSPTMNKLILLTTTETSTLLAQVAERIDDIRRMSVARRDALLKVREKESPSRPIQIVSPEKSKKQFPAEKKEIEVVRGDLSCCRETPTQFVHPSAISHQPQSPRSISREMHVIAELLNTERSYVGELESIVEHYVDPFSATEHQTQIAPPIRGRPDLVFGNLKDLLLFHSSFLINLQEAENSPSAICRCFLQNQSKFLNLYIPYCQNKSPSEAIRKEFADSTSFFTECQRRAGHPLPLGAYLLKPVQRITKYQLLLKELERNSRAEVRSEVEAAVCCMLELLNRINSAIQQLHIIGFAGDLRLMGPLRLQTECDVFAFNRKKGRRTTRAQRRHLFLFDGGLVLCKKRNPLNSSEPEYYEYKNSISTSCLNYCDQSKSGSSRFEVWDETKNDGWAVETLDTNSRSRWVDCLNGLTVSREDQGSQKTKGEEGGRPRSWTSTLSTDSVTSTRSPSEHSNESMDSNGNGSQSQTVQCLLDSPTGNSQDLLIEEAPPLPDSQPPRSTTFHSTSSFVPNIEESHSPEENVNC
ncbi:unnamed protein product, partial [Mesorhabditis belari]|uniref:DH domain-containing protein n=1 Tax=Mesorhabditis belari TaxID=2138241 RepID=A0AAF3ENZ7_9BILA